MAKQLADLITLASPSSDDFALLREAASGLDKKITHDDLIAINKIIKNYPNVGLDHHDVPKDIFQATTNLVDDPEDLTTVGWTKANLTAALSDLYFDGKRFNKVIATATNAVFLRDVEVTTATSAFQGIFRRGEVVDLTLFQILDRTVTVVRGQIEIDWDTDIITGHQSYKWIDKDTVWVSGVAVGMIPANDNEVNIYPDYPGTAGSFLYATAIQVEDITYPTPYINGSRPAIAPDYTFEMPEKFTIDMIIRPWFAYDTGDSHRFVLWLIDGTHYFRFFYDLGNDKITIWWRDGGSVQGLTSQQFDNGSSYVNINQRIRVIAGIDLSTGDTSGSRLIVEPLESGAISEDTVWSANIDGFSSTFSTLSIGHDNEILQADSEFEYLRIYSGPLIGIVTDSDAADVLLEGRIPIFDGRTSAMRNVSLPIGTSLTTILKKLYQEDIKFLKAGQQNIVNQRLLDNQEMIVEDVKAYNVAGGTFTQDAGQTRNLNTVQYNTIAGASLAANQITLPPGTYEVEWSCPAYRVSRHWTWVYDITGAAILIMGGAMYADNNYNGENISLGRGVFTLSIESVLELRHRCIMTVTTEGFGVSSNTSGYNNVYSQIKIVRKA